MHLLDGEWDSEAFLVIPPAGTLTPTYDDKVIGITCDLAMSTLKSAPRQPSTCKKSTDTYHHQSGEPTTTIRPDLNGLYGIRLVRRMSSM